MAPDDSGAMVRNKFSFIVSEYLMVQRRIIAGFMMVMVVWPLIAMGQYLLESNCGDPYDSSRSGGFGPYDLYDPAIPKKIELVVSVHFTPYMEEMAINGSTTRQAVIKEERIGGQQLVAGNLDYTLRAIPNHARALYAMGMWQLRLREQSMQEFLNKKLAWEFKSAECYFERAVMFIPDDGLVRLAYGVFRHKQGRFNLALENYLEAIRLMPSSAEAHYNIGLLYFELNDYASAREHARKADGIGYPLTGLRSKLMRQGEWEPRKNDVLEPSISQKD